MQLEQSIKKHKLVQRLIVNKFILHKYSLFITPARLGTIFFVTFHSFNTCTLDISLICSLPMLHYIFVVMFCVNHQHLLYTILSIDTSCQYQHQAKNSIVSIKTLIIILRLVSSRLLPPHAHFGNDPLPSLVLPFCGDFAKRYKFGTHCNTL